MRYIYAAFAAMLMTGCAGSSKTAGPDADVNRPAQPQTSVIAQPVQQAAAAGTANSSADGNVINVGEVQDQGTDTLMSESARRKTRHQGTDPLQCLMAWVQSNQKNNPYLKTCEASPPSN